MTVRWPWEFQKQISNTEKGNMLVDSIHCSGHSINLAMGFTHRYEIVS